MKQRGTIAIVVWLFFVIACGFIVSHSKYNADLSAFLPTHPTATQQLFVDQLQNGVASRLILTGIEGADAKTRASLSKTIAQQLRSMPEFISVSNGEQIGTERERKFFFDNRYLLSPAINHQRFTAKGLHDAIAGSIDLLASPMGMLIKPLFKQDPTGEMLQLLTILNNGNHPHTVNGVWTSHDGKRAILLLQTRAAGSDIDAQQRAVTLIQDTFNKALKKQALTKKASTAQLLLTGPGVFSVSSRKTIKQEVTHLSIISAILIVTLLLSVYRSLTAVFLGTLPIATGILAGIATVSLGFGVVHGVTLGFGITLIGEAVDYSIYLFIQSQQNKTNHNGQTYWLKNFWPTIRLGVATSVIGFASLLFSGFPGLAQLGLYSISGLIIAALVTRFVLPNMLPRDFRIRDISQIGNLLIQVSRYAKPLRWLTVIVTVASCLIIYGHRHTVWNSDLAALSPIPTADRNMDARLRKDLGAPDPRYLVAVSANSMDEALARAERVSNILDKLVTEGVIAGYDSPSRYLPSLEMQRLRKQAIPPRAELAERLKKALTGLPIHANVLNGFLDSAEAARSSRLLQRDDLKNSSLAIAVDALLIKHHKHWSALLPLRAPVINNSATPIDAQRIRTVLRKADITSTSFIDVKTELDQLYSRYLNDAIWLSLGGLAAILVLLFVVLRSPIRAIRIVSPLGLSVLIVTAGLLMCGVHLTILHLVGMLLIVAVGSNYALFFDQGSQDSVSNDKRRTLASSLFANITTVTVFGLLAFSKVPVLENIGITVAPGVVLALLFSAILTDRPTTINSDSHSR